MVALPISTWPHTTTMALWSRDRQTIMGDSTAFSKTEADLLGNRKFESTSLQRRVCCELDFGHYGAPRTRCSGLSSSARALLLLFPVERAVRAPFSSSLVRLCFNRRLLDIRISCSNSCNFAYIASPRRDLIQVNQSDRIYSTAR